MKSFTKEHLPYSLLIAILLLSGCKPDAQAAYNQCVSSCLAEHRCQTTFTADHPGIMRSDCLIVQNQCFADCAAKNGSSFSVAPPEPVAPIPGETAPKTATIYGAIAIDKTNGAWGISDSYPDKKRAEISALYYCDQHGTDCKIVSSFTNTCAAIMADTNITTTWATAATVDAAQDQAQQKCVKKGDNSCVLQIVHCYF